MAQLVSDNPEFFLTTLLREVSRSFYLTLRVLPAPIRPQIGFAYLLARASDTIADTDAISLAGRLEALQRLRDRIMGMSTGDFDLGDFTDSQASDGEKLLLARLDEILLLVRKFPEHDLAAIRQVLEVIISGQALDLERFQNASSRHPIALASAGELDDYTYRVAGCVGEFWTRMCIGHLQPTPRIDLDCLVQKGIRFGKGLQLVNILRDLPADLQKGRCYLPISELREAGLSPRELLDPGNETSLRPLFDHWLGIAGDHLEAGWSYVLDLPWSWARVRLACAWPILIGHRTLDLLRTEHLLDPKHRTKISRAQVRAILFKSTLLYPLSPLWTRLGPGTRS